MTTKVLRRGVEFVFFGTPAALPIASLPVVHGLLWETWSVSQCLEREKTTLRLGAKVQHLQAAKQLMQARRASLLNPGDVDLEHWVAANASCVRKADAWFSSKPLADMIAVSNGQRGDSETPAGVTQLRDRLLRLIVCCLQLAVKPQRAFRRTSSQHSGPTIPPMCPTPHHARHEGARSPDEQEGQNCQAQ